MNTNLRDQIRGILKENGWLHNIDTITDDILKVLPSSKSYPQEYKISTSKQTVNLEEYIKASQHDGV